MVRPEIPLSHFGKRLNALAIKAGISKQMLAKAAGIRNRATMSRCIRAKGTSKTTYAPPLEALFVWADELKLTANDRRQFIILGILARVDDATAAILWRELGENGDYPPSLG